MASTAEYGLVLAIVGTGIALAAYSIAPNLRSGGPGDNVVYNVGWNNIDPGTSSNLTVPSEVQPGQGAFIKPRDMEVGAWFPVEFIVGLNADAIREEAEDLPLTQARSIYISGNMRVRLLPDPNFEMAPKSDSLQSTGPDKSATWQWDVKPLVPGTHTLIAQVEVLERRPDKTFQAINQYSRRVSIRATVGTVRGLINGIRNAETVGGTLTTMFNSWAGTLAAIALLITAGFGIRWAIIRGQKGTPAVDPGNDPAADTMPHGGKAD